MKPDHSICLTKFRTPLNGLIRDLFHAARCLYCITSFFVYLTTKLFVSLLIKKIIKITALALRYELNFSKLGNDFFGKSITVHDNVFKKLQYLIGPEHDKKNIMDPNHMNKVKVSLL